GVLEEGPSRLERGQHLLLPLLPAHPSRARGAGGDERPGDRPAFLVAHAAGDAPPLVELEVAARRPVGAGPGGAVGPGKVVGVAREDPVLALLEPLDPVAAIGERDRA